MAHPIAKPIQAKEQIIALVTQGRKLSEISEITGIPAVQISKHLAADQDYREAKETAMEASLDRLERDIEKADSMLALSRAREMGTSLRWRAEREHRRIWGKDTVQDPQGITVVINRGDLDNDRVVATVQRDTDPDTE